MLPSELIKQGWCQGTSATDANGVKVLSTDPNACRFCLVGALNKAFVAGTFSESTWDALLESVQLDSPNVKSLVDWNDAPERTQQDVIDLLEGMGL